MFTNFKKIDAKGEHKLTEIDPTKENLVVKGNNLLVLHSLKKQFAGKIKLVYLDSPYNTGNDEFSYNDKFNHSTWLTFMRNRLEVAKLLLRSDGIIFVQISDKEVGYLNVLMDEVFERCNFINKITVSVRAPTGFKVVNLGLFETSEYILVYGKDKQRWKYNPQYEACEYDANYDSLVENKLLNPEEWRIQDLAMFVATKLGCKTVREARQKYRSFFDYQMGEFALQNKERVFRLTAINDDASKETVDLREKSKKNLGKVYFQSRGEDMRPRYILNGQVMTFYENKVRQIDGRLTPSTVLTNIWKDISWEGIAPEGGVTLNKGKKPEALLKRIVEMSTNKGDLVLDFFSGSGTTCAVAHKLGRKFIGIEQLDYGKNSTFARLTNVVKGDQTGISKITDWKGGGSFVYCELMKQNEKFVEAVKDAKTTKELLKLWEEMKETAFISHSIMPGKFEENKKDFSELSLANQKKFLLECLDKNQLYVNFSEIGDKDNKVSEADKKLNKQFYGEAA